jgi:hypothetical protein
VLCTHGFRWFDSPGSPAHFVSQAGSLVTRRVLVADATFKRPKDFCWICIVKTRGKIRTEYIKVRKDHGYKERMNQEQARSGMYATPG